MPTNVLGRNVPDSTLSCSLSGHTPIFESPLSGLGVGKWEDTILRKKERAFIARKGRCKVAVSQEMALDRLQPQ